jgi:hypothetical protein
VDLLPPPKPYAKASGIRCSASCAAGFAIRVASVNHCSRREDFELLARSVARIGDDIINS